MSNHDPLTLDDVAYTADVNVFLKTLARIMTRVLGQGESSDDNESQTGQSGERRSPA